MREIEKLFRKISAKERASLLLFIDQLLNDELRAKLSVKKLSGSDLYRVRKGNFRLIFHYGEAHELVIDSVRLRDEHTYRDI